MRTDRQDRKDGGDLAELSSLPAHTKLMPLRYLRGFTVLEMFVVLILLAILAAMAAPATGRFLDSLNVRKQTQQIMATLRYSRLVAVSRGREVKVEITEGAGIMRLSGAVEKEVDFDFGGEGSLIMEPHHVVFYPEGHVTPAVLIFTMGKNVRRIVLDPLTALPVID